MHGECLGRMQILLQEHLLCMREGLLGPGVGLWEKGGAWGFTVHVRGVCGVHEEGMRDGLELVTHETCRETAVVLVAGSAAGSGAHACPRARSQQCPGRDLHLCHASPSGETAPPPLSRFCCFIPHPTQTVVQPFLLLLLLLTVVYCCLTCKSANFLWTLLADLSAQALGFFCETRHASPPCTCCSCLYICLLVRTRS